jgi:cyclo(L-tyrosyl-L-tyrosyl) synthase
MHITESSFNDKTPKLQDKAIIIGVSINNSYFKEENIRSLVNWSCEQSSTVFIMIPDDPMVHTLMALGYTEIEAKRKVRLKTNALRNLCCRIIGIRKVRIITWSDVIPSLQYLVGIGQIFSLYKENEKFRQEVKKVTSEVIIANGGTLSDDNIDHGVQFLIKELAFITHSDLILGQKSIAYVYHKTMGLLKDLIIGKYPLYIDPNINFITVS